MDRAMKGFTLIELMVVVGLGALIASFGLFVSIDGYKHELFQSEAYLLLSVLEKARSDAMNNKSSSGFGVHVDGESYVLFRGTEYISGNDFNLVYERNKNIVVTANEDSVFSQLSGDVFELSTIEMSDGIRSRKFVINHEGAITW